MRIAFSRRPSSIPGIKSGYPMHSNANRGRLRSLLAQRWSGFGFGSLLSLAMATASPAQTFTVLATFDKTNGSGPYASVVQGTNGYFYGTTIAGGANGAEYGGYGTVFKVSSSGKLSTVHNFCDDVTDNCPDGFGPYGSLLLAANDDFYGTTQEGGAYGAGTVFKIAPGGTLITLHSFCEVDGSNGCTDGDSPWSGLVEGKGSNFYGTTQGGGANGDGTVFKMTSEGILTTLYSFCNLSNCADGSEPESTLVFATDGNLYGTTTTAMGGADNYGTVFKLTPAGKLTTLHTFCSETSCADGYSPGPLMQGSDGNFYGTTSRGGNSSGTGTVFKITRSGKLTTLYSFCTQPSCADGADPEAALIQASDGNFYGTTSEGGAYADGTDGGTVFKITPSGEESVLHSFCANGAPGCTDGSSPSAAIAQGTDGNFYGTTFGLYGSVWKLTTGIKPFVSTVPTSAAVGTKVTILGTELTGATSVTFNGVAATIETITANDIITTVPAGATTGFVEVTTPAGTLNSNLVFTVAE